MGTMDNDNSVSTAVTENESTKVIDLGDVYDDEFYDETITFDTEIRSNSSSSSNRSNSISRNSSRSNSIEIGSIDPLLNSINNDIDNNSNDKLQNDTKINPTTSNNVYDNNYSNSNINNNNNKVVIVQSQQSNNDTNTNRNPFFYNNNNNNTGNGTSNYDSNNKDTRRKKSTNNSNSNNVNLFGRSSASVEIPVLYDFRQHNNNHPTDSTTNSTNTINNSTKLSSTKVDISTGDIPILRITNNQYVRVHGTTSCHSFGRTGYVTSDILFKYNHNFRTNNNTNQKNESTTKSIIPTTTTTTTTTTKTRNNNNTANSINSSISMISITSGIRNIGLYNNENKQKQQQSSSSVQKESLRTISTPLYNGAFVTITQTDRVNLYNTSKKRVADTTTTTTTKTTTMPSPTPSTYTINGIVHTKSITIHGNQSIHISKTYTCNVQFGPTTTKATTALLARKSIAQQQREQLQHEQQQQVQKGITLVDALRCSIHTDCYIKPSSTTLSSSPSSLSSSSSSSSSLSSHGRFYMNLPTYPRFNVRVSIASNHSNTSNNNKTRTFNVPIVNKDDSQQILTTTSSSSTSTATIKTKQYINSLLRIFHWNFIFGWTSTSSSSSNTLLVVPTAVYLLESLTNFLLSPTITLRVSPNNSIFNNTNINRTSGSTDNKDKSKTTLSLDANCTYRPSTYNNNKNSISKKEIGVSKVQTGLPTVWNFGAFWTRRYNYNTKNSITANANANDTTTSSKTQDQVLGIGIVWNYLPNLITSTSHKTSTMQSSSSSSPTITWIFTWTQGDYTIRIPITIFIGLLTTTSSTAAVATTTASASFYTGCIAVLCLNIASRIIHEIVYYTVHISKLNIRKRFLQKPEQPQEKEGNENGQNTQQSQPSQNPVLIQRVTALRQQELMKKSAINKMKKEQEMNGLVITKAIYRCSLNNTIDDNNGKDNDNDNNNNVQLDVTIPLQFWVSDSKLKLRSPLYDMLGFYNVSLSSLLSQQQQQSSIDVCSSDRNDDTRNNNSNISSYLSSMVQYFWFGSYTSNKCDHFDSGNTDKYSNNNAYEVHEPSSSSSLSDNGSIDRYLDVWYTFQGVEYYCTVCEGNDDFEDIKISSSSPPILLLPSET